MNYKQRQAIEDAISRLTRALAYGKDMKSSSDLCMVDAEALIRQARNEPEWAKDCQVAMNRQIMAWNEGRR